MSLDPPYAGPYKVLDRKAKYFKVEVRGKANNISLDRLKPAYPTKDRHTDNASTVPACLPSSTSSPPADKLTTFNRRGRRVPFPDYYQLQSRSGQWGAVAAPRPHEDVASSSCLFGDLRRGRAPFGFIADPATVLCSPLPRHSRSLHCSSAETCRRPPGQPFRLDGPEMWLAQMECQIVVANVTVDLTMRLPSDGYQDALQYFKVQFNSSQWKYYKYLRANTTQPQPRTSAFIYLQVYQRRRVVPSATAWVF